MSTKDIRPAQTYIPCDICGRTLLRGERAEAFIGGGNRHQVCELCKPRAIQEGWIREGSVPDYDPSLRAQERRRSIFGRRRRSDEPAGIPRPAANLDDALSGSAWPVEPAEQDSSQSNARPRTGRGRNGARERPASARERRTGERGAQRGVPPESRISESAPEPRNVHAVPTGEDQRMAAAVAAFNASEHPRTVAGVARSLGAPAVAVLADPGQPTLVRVVICWELCWYRYEVDLANPRASVRLDAQGYELSELAPEEQVASARADDAGQLHVAL